MEGEFDVTMNSYYYSNHVAGASSYTPDLFTNVPNRNQ